MAIKTSEETQADLMRSGIAAISQAKKLAVAAPKQTAHEFALSQSVGVLLNYLHTGLTPVEAEVLGAQQKAAILKLAKLQESEKIPDRVFLSSLLVAGAGFYAASLEESAEATEDATFQAVAINTSSWHERNGVRICDDHADCGHQHKTIATAEACLSRLTAKGSATWFHAEIRDGAGNPFSLHPDSD